MSWEEYNPSPPASGWTPPLAQITLPQQKPGASGARVKRGNAAGGGKGKQTAGPNWPKAPQGGKPSPTKPKTKTGDATDKAKDPTQGGTPSQQQYQIRLKQTRPREVRPPRSGSNTQQQYQMRERPHQKGGDDALTTLTPLSRAARRRSRMCRLAGCRAVADSPAAAALTAAACDG